MQQAESNILLERVPRQFEKQFKCNMMKRGIFKTCKACFVAVSINENQFEAQEHSDCPGVAVKALSLIDKLVKKGKVKLIMLSHSKWKV